MSMRRVGLTFLLVSALTLVGCGGGSSTTPVSGSVSWQNQKLDHGLVNFFREGTAVAGCAIQPDGTHGMPSKPST